MAAEHNGRSITGLKLIGTGRALPANCIPSASLDEHYGHDAGHVASLTGVEKRYYCEHETQIDMAIAAAKKALADADLQPDALDMVISACAVPYQPIPATAPAIQRGLGIADGACFATDINCTCLGFPAALHFADGLARSGDYTNILVVSSEIASRGLPWKKQPQVAGLFGDGAGAAVLRVGTDGGIRSARFATFPSAYEACSLGAGGTRFDFENDAAQFAAHSQFTMDGKELFRVTAKHFGAFVDDLLARADTKRADIARVIAHQASPGALAHMIKLCKFAPEQVVNIAADVGNQIAASIPFTLDYARENGLVRAGDRIVLLGTSAGVSFGGLVMDI